MEQRNRHLAAILFTDVVGFTALMQQNEKEALVAIKKHNSVLENLTIAYHGQVVNYYGDGSLCIFQSATEAIHCAIAIQSQMREDPAVPIRVGLHIGEVFFEEGKALGDGVNLASRIQSLGQANTILFSGELQDKIKNNAEFNFVSLGLFDFKNVDKPIEVYALSNRGLFVPKKEQLEGKLNYGVHKYSYLKKSMLFVVILILMISSLLIYNFFAGKKNYSVKNKSVVVIPFQNINGNQSNEYLSNGISEDIVTQLSKITDLKVISGPSTLQYKNSKKTPKQIAEETGASSLLEGTLQIFDNTIRITARLIDVSTNELIWSDNYDNKDKMGVLSIQSQVALKIAEELNAKLSAEEKSNIQKPPTSNPEAYNLCLQGRAFWNQRNEAALRKGLIYFDSAIKLDPLYSNAYSGKADCLTALGYGSYDSPVNTFLKAQEAATKALKLDPLLAEPHASLGYINFYFAWNWSAAEQEFKTAIRLNPKYEIAYDWYGVYLTAMERFTDARSQIEKAKQLNPMAPNIITDMGFSFYYGSKYDDAIRSLKSTLELYPGFSLAHLWLGRAYQDKKMYKEALEEYKIAQTLNKDWVPIVAAIGNIYGITGNKIEAEKILVRLKDWSSQKYVTPYGIALVYAALGNKNNAFEYLEKAYQDRSNWLVWLKLDPRWDQIRSDTRFTELVKKVGLPE